MTFLCNAFARRSCSTSLACVGVRSIPAPDPRPRPPAAHAGHLAPRADLRDGAGAAPRRTGNGARTAESPGRLLRVPPRRGPRSPARVQGADGIPHGRPPGADRRSGPALGGADAGPRGGAGGRRHAGRLGQRGAAGATRAAARLSPPGPPTLLPPL